MEGHTSADVFVVLVAALKVLDVRCQVGVDNAEASVVENKPNCYASFVSLKIRYHFGVNMKYTIWKSE